MKNLLLASIVSLLVSPAALAENFVESRTSADLTNGQDSIQSTLSVGTRSDNLEASFGVGYLEAGGENSQPLARLEVRSYHYLGNNITLEGEVDVLYLTEDDRINITPEVRVRKYF